MKKKDIGRAAALLLLLSPLAALAQGADRSNRGAVPARRCFTVTAESAGLYELTLHTRQSSTAPSLMVLSDRGPDPQSVGRIETTLYEVEQAGELPVCFAAAEMVGKAFVHFEKVDPARRGDPKEVEVEEDP